MKAHMSDKLRQILLDPEKKRELQRLLSQSSTESACEYEAKYAFADSNSSNYQTQKTK